MPRDFLPSRESELVQWSSNFRNLILVSSQSYNLTPALATQYDTTHTAFVSAYTLLQEPATNNAPNVAAKNDAKEALLAEARELVRLVQAGPTVTDAQRRNLRITVRDTEPSPVPAPSTAPAIDIESVIGRTIRVRLHEEGFPTKRGKPTGVAGASVFSFVGESAPEDFKQWRFEGSTTQTTLDITFPITVPGGSKVWITSFWFNPTLESGPATTPVSTNIAGGLAQAA